MNNIERYLKIRDSVPSTVKIVAVSKTKPASFIEELYLKTGLRSFGENKIQELTAKAEILPSDLEWHFIGHLQTNKIKYIASYINLIQSIDSFRLLEEINREAIKNNRIISCLLQFHIAEENSKYGFTLEEAIRMLNDNRFHLLSNISVQGVMGMATNTENKQLIQSEFKNLYSYFQRIKSSYFADKPEFKEVSMGMSSDYQIAIAEGSTIVRIGSGIFGDR
jgi:hypothetical protein